MMLQHTMAVNWTVVRSESTTSEWPNATQRHPNRVFPKWSVRLKKNDPNILLVLSREWMGMGVAGMIITSDEMDHSLIPCV